MQESKLYVGGIPYTTKSEELKEYFSKAGEVKEAIIITERNERGMIRSKGFGFVEMVNPEDAQKAISMFHDKEFMGRNLTVNLARPKEEREDRGRRNF